MRALGLVLSALLTVSCAERLPSETPLGLGPLAKKEAALRAKAEKDAEARNKATDAGAVAQAPPPEEPAPVAEPPPSVPTPTATPPKPEAPAKKEPGKKSAAVVVTYAGEYVGSDTSVYKIQGTPERSEKDDKARTRVEGNAPEISVTFIDSGTGKDICTLKGKTNGKSVSFAAGQKCWGDGPGMSGTLRQGSAKFEDKKLTIDMDFDVVLAMGDIQAKGDLHYHFEGTRN